MFLSFFDRRNRSDEDEGAAREKKKKQKKKKKHLNPLWVSKSNRSDHCKMNTVTIFFLLMVKRLHTRRSESRNLSHHWNGDLLVDYHSAKSLSYACVCVCVLMKQWENERGRRGKRWERKKCNFFPFSLSFLFDENDFDKQHAHKQPKLSVNVILHSTWKFLSMIDFK